MDFRWNQVLKQKIYTMAASLEPEGQFEDIGSKKRFEMSHINDFESSESKPLLNNIQPEIMIDNTNVSACYSTKRPMQQKKNTSPYYMPTTENIVHVSCRQGHLSKLKRHVSCPQLEKIPIKTSNTIVTVEESNEMEGLMEKTETVVDVPMKKIDKQERHTVMNIEDTVNADCCKGIVKKYRLSAALLIIMFLLPITIVSCYHYLFMRPLYAIKDEIFGNNHKCSKKIALHIMSVEFRPNNFSMVDSAEYITWNPPELANSFVLFNDTGQLVRLDDKGQRVIAQENGTYSIFVSLMVDGAKCKRRHIVTNTMICLRNSKNEKEKCAKETIGAYNVMTLNVNDHIFLETNDRFFVSGSGFDCGDPDSSYMTVIKY